MLPLDESKWELVMDRSFTKKDPWEEIPVNLNFPCDRAIVTIQVLAAKPSWVRGGGVTQKWQRLLVPIEVAYSRLYLSQPKVIEVEPLKISTLWFWSHHWITDLQIVVEGRRVTG